ncbi:MAG TPA: D-glycero-beta-D-manno-heptose 1-phosphate adenylyltransferase [Chitinophagales bacterium]|nr:D-glycero-beta-D-manno-heptose 1-phosphate adenylyltransferase [Chitinophagales bacterium]
MPQLLQQISVWRFHNRQIVFTNGCFDILHKGHAHVLNTASELAYNAAVIVGVNTDASVKRLKGESRPINNQNDRAFMLASLYAVSAVVLFDEETPYALIQAIQPDFIVKGGDYTPDTIVGADIVQARGGKVVVVPFLENYSTTGLVEKMKLPELPKHSS